MVRRLALLAAVLPFLTLAAKAQESPGNPPVRIMKKADPNEKADGTMGPAAKAAMENGPLPMSADDVAAKAAADRDRENAKSPFRGPLAPAQPGGAAQPLAPVQPGFAEIAGFNTLGLNDTSTTPSDSTGAIGPTRYIQLVNQKAGIFNRTTAALINSGTLNTLADVPSTVRSFDPQIIWDATTQRFYYVMDSVFSNTDNRLAFGFSKTADPSNLSTDFCHYLILFEHLFPDYPKLGQSEFFSIIGWNLFKEDITSDTGHRFVESALFAAAKPPGGSGCPGDFARGETPALRDSGGLYVFTPVPANQIDPYPTGYAVARNLSMPSARLWFFSVTQKPDGFPEFGPARLLAVPLYEIPPSASQPLFTQVLDTLDARNTQAVQSIDPSLGKFAFWTQHTVRQGNQSVVQWYEIDPVPDTPVVLHSGVVGGAPGTFAFNAAISPDRAATPSAFGDSFVIQYNSSSLSGNEFPSIHAASGANGTLDSIFVVAEGLNPYRDFSCTNPNKPKPCRWGDYSAAAPDPSPSLLSASRGVVWGTNQYSRVFPVEPGAVWSTRIFAVAP